MVKDDQDRLCQEGGVEGWKLRYQSMPTGKPNGMKASAELHGLVQPRHSLHTGTHAGSQGLQFCMRHTDYFFLRMSPICLTQRALT